MHTLHTLHTERRQHWIEEIAWLALLIRRGNNEMVFIMDEKSAQKTARSISIYGMETQWVNREETHWQDVKWNGIWLCAFSFQFSVWKIKIAYFMKIVYCGKSGNGIRSDSLVIWTIIMKRRIEMRRILVFWWIWWYHSSSNRCEQTKFRLIWFGHLNKNYIFDDWNFIYLHSHSTHSLFCAIDSNKWDIISLHVFCHHRLLYRKDKYWCSQNIIRGNISK